MCYLIAKSIDEEGCVALRTTHGKHLSAFKRSIEKRVGYDKIQLVTISRLSFCFLNTLTIIFIFFEYLNALKILNILKALKSLTIFISKTSSALGR